MMRLIDCGTTFSTELSIDECLIKSPFLSSLEEGLGLSSPIIMVGHNLPRYASVAFPFINAFRVVAVDRLF